MRANRALCNVYVSTTEQYLTVPRSERGPYDGSPTVSFDPTPEQQAAIEAFKTGQNVVLEAGAGAGKTSTLKLLAEVNLRKRGVYAAFNRSIADDAARRFPSSVLCKTLHSLAYRPQVGPVGRERLNLPRQNGRAVARILGINDPVRITAQVVLAPHQIASIVMETVTRFCNSDAEEPQRWNVPTRNGLEEPAARAVLAAEVLPWARKAWADLNSKTGQLRWTHDVYLKRFALSRPHLGADYLFLDEAQDSNGVTLQIVRAQTNTQIVTVGDRHQAIYGWRGASDAMDAFGGTRLRLSQSFRFGPAVAEQANLWLDALGSDMRITGTPSIDSRLLALDAPDAVLTRTNAEAVARVMEYQGSGVPVALVGGGDAMEKLAEAAEQLKERGQTWHPDLMAFQSWGQVQDYVEQEASGSDLRTFVKLIDAHGTQSVIAAMRRLADERRADVVVSTAHKAKGREWHQVKVGLDFAEPKPNAETGETTMPQDEGMLAYVTVTRAQHALDRGSLSYIDRFLAERGGPATVASAATAREAAEDAQRERVRLGTATFPIAGQVCGAESTAYTGVSCKLAPHGDEVLHDAAIPGLSGWGPALTRQRLSA